MHSKNLASAVSAVLLTAIGGVAAADTKTTSIPVSATVASNCVVSASNLSFGNYDGSAAKSGTANVTVRCSNGTDYEVMLSAGGGSFSKRLLDGGTGNELEYNLYTSAALGSVWGDGTAGTATVTDTGRGMSATKANVHTVHGELPNSDANQDAPAGSYSDTITVTVEY